MEMTQREGGREWQEIVVDGDDSTRGWERMAGNRGGWRRLVERVGENGRGSWWMEKTQREGGTD